MALVGAILPAEARADALRLENNDLIRGEVTGGDDKVLKFKHVFGSEMTIPWEKVVYVQTDKPVELKLKDGSKLKGKLVFGDKPQATVMESESAGPIKVSFDKVAAVNEPPESLIWTGRIAIGFTVQDGNTRSKTAFGSLDAEMKGKNFRIELHALYQYGLADGDVNARNSFVRAQYSHYVVGSLYLYLGGALEYDRFKDLRLRSRGGAGLGYAFFDTKDLILRLEAGAEYVNQDFFVAEDQDFVAARFAGHFEWQVTDFCRIGEILEVLPNTERWSDFVSRSTSFVNLSIWKGFGVAFVVIWTHDEEPPAGTLRDDTTYIATLTYVF